MIVDGKTHKASELSAEDYFKKFDDVTSVTGKRVSDDNLEIRVSLSGGEEVIDNIEINENTEIYNSTDNSYELGDEFVIDSDLKGLNGISEYSEIPAEEIQKILNEM